MENILKHVLAPKCADTRNILSLVTQMLMFYFHFFEFGQYKLNLHLAVGYKQKSVILLYDIISLFIFIPSRQNLGPPTSGQVRIDDWISSDMDPSKSKGTTPLQANSATPSTANCRSLHHVLIRYWQCGHCQLADLSAVQRLACWEQRNTRVSRCNAIYQRSVRL